LVGFSRRTVISAVRTFGFQGLFELNGVDVGPHKAVPEVEVRLAVVGLYACQIVVHVVVTTVVGKKNLQRIPRKMISAMVVNGFQCRESHKNSRQYRIIRHATRKDGNTSSSDIQEKGLERMII